jgi:hypothetical protein
MPSASEEFGRAITEVSASLVESSERVFEQLDPIGCSVWNQSLCFRQSALASAAAAALMCHGR